MNILVPVGKLKECDHCKALRGVKAHPMMAHLWSDKGYCECSVMRDFVEREEYCVSPLDMV